MKMFEFKKDKETATVAEKMATLPENEETTEAVSEEEENEDEEIIRPYTLRKLKDGDLIPLLKILRMCGLKDFKESLVQVANGNTSLQEVGAMVIFDMADIVVGNITGAAGEDIYNFYSELSGLSVVEIKEMEFGTLPLMIYDSFNEVKNTGFFKVLSKLL